MILLLQNVDDLSLFQKNALINRYIDLVENLQKRTWIYAYIFHVGRVVVTVGSLIVPALLSIQYTSVNGTDFSEQIYWVTWVISLLVTTWNGILTLFKVDKKYYFLHTINEQFQSEAWQYIHLSGKYGGTHYLKGQKPTHGNMFPFFCNQLERIRMKQIQEEYFKLLDSKEKGPVDLSGNGVGPVDGRSVAGMYLPTPDQHVLQERRQELARAISQRAPQNTVIAVRPDELPEDFTDRLMLRSVVEDGSPSKDTKEAQGGETPTRAADSVSVPPVPATDEARPTVL